MNMSSVDMQGNQVVKLEIHEGADANEMNYGLARNNSGKLENCLLECNIQAGVQEQNHYLLGSTNMCRSEDLKNSSLMGPIKEQMLNQQNGVTSASQDFHSAEPNMCNNSNMAQQGHLDHLNNSAQVGHSTLSSGTDELHYFPRLNPSVALSKEPSEKMQSHSPTLLVIPEVPFPSRVGFGTPPKKSHKKCMLGVPPPAAAPPTQSMHPQVVPKVEGGSSSLPRKKVNHPCHFAGCQKTYSNSWHLNAHLLWHKGERPFVCKWPSCTKSFYRSDKLLRHLRTHTGDKPFSCCICDKRFSRSDHLSKHSDIHFHNDYSLQRL